MLLNVMDAQYDSFAPVAAVGRFELYKTSHFFDGTWKNPQWLG